MVSVIIPVYNEEKVVSDCINSLLLQTNPSFEIIIVDDGSTDGTSEVLSKFSSMKFGKKHIDIRILSQNHKGAGLARNLAAEIAKGDIFVFADADMTFDENFIKDLVIPIEKKEAVGTFSREEYLSNKDNLWAVCWNINRYLINGWKFDKEVYERILPSYYPDKQPVFRAILKTEFSKAGGFEDTGYADDWTLYRKLGIMAKAVTGAKYYHSNPGNLREAFLQSRWIGGNQFISGNIIRKLYNLIRYSLPFSLVWGFIASVKTGKTDMIFFKIIYDLGIITGIMSSLKKGSVKK